MRSRLTCWKCGPKADARTRRLNGRVNGSAWNGQPGTKPEAALCAEHNGHGKPFSAPKYQPGGEKYRKPVQPQEPSVDEQTAARVGAEILTGDAV